MKIETDGINGRFDLRQTVDKSDVLVPFAGPCALEDDNFPFEAISEVAETESWRKEINRPVYHIHKWWAQRLGTVFRAVALGALAPSGTDILSAFYRPTRVQNLTVFDPFMGSGTTIGEAAKLGARAIGRDINPVAHFLVRNALAFHDREAVFRTFLEIEHDVADNIRAYYKTALPDGTEADVLYYFWVKLVDCPECACQIELFSTRVFAKHSNPRRYPDAKAICPSCGEVNSVRFDAIHAACERCAAEFDPQSGPARGRTATCPECEHCFAIGQTIRERNAPPGHRLYAKLVLNPEGKKVYSAATDEDRNSYAVAEKALRDRINAFPIIGIEPGCNTNQALGYNYRYWHQMFNARQLLCLSILADRIREIREPTLRELFACLFRACLNSTICSHRTRARARARSATCSRIMS